jgi:ABC-type lipoprotein release transport system permease subunit
MDGIVGCLIGLVIGILACYAWQKGFIKEVGIE